MIERTAGKISKGSGPTGDHRGYIAEIDPRDGHIAGIMFFSSDAFSTVKTLGAFWGERKM